MSGERSLITLVVQNARVAHAKSVDTLPDGEVDDLDHLGRTLDQAIADALLATSRPVVSECAATGSCCRCSNGSGRGKSSYLFQLRARSTKLRTQTPDGPFGM